MTYAAEPACRANTPSGWVAAPDDLAGPGWQQLDALLVDGDTAQTLEADAAARLRIATETFSDQLFTLQTLCPLAGCRGCSSPVRRPHCLPRARSRPPWPTPTALAGFAAVNPQLGTTRAGMRAAARSSPGQLMAELEQLLAPASDGAQTRRPAPGARNCDESWTPRRVEPGHVAGPARRLTSRRTLFPGHGLRFPFRPTAPGLPHRL